MELEEVGERLSPLRLGPLAMEGASGGKDDGWVSPERGVGGDPDPEGADLVLVDLAEVDQDASLDVTVVPVALGEAGVDTATLGTQDVEVEPSPLGGHVKFVELRVEGTVNFQCKVYIRKGHMHLVNRYSR